MKHVEENDLHEPTIADRRAAEAALKPFCLHASVDLVEFVALAIKYERDRCTKIFIKTSDAQLRLTQSAEREICQLKVALQARHDELGFDAARAESAEFERDRAKAEAQRAEQELKLLKQSVSNISDNWGKWDGQRFSSELRDLLRRMEE